MNAIHYGRTLRDSVVIRGFHNHGTNLIRVCNESTHGVRLKFRGMTQSRIEHTVVRFRAVCYILAVSSGLSNILHVVRELRDRGHDLGAVIWLDGLTSRTRTDSVPDRE